MAKTVHHSQFMTELDKKGTIIFYTLADDIVVHNSHIL